MAGVFALFGSLRRSLRHDAATAALLTGVYLTSCYFFGYAFRWLTDDLALTFCILALAQLFRFADPTSPRAAAGLPVRLPVVVGGDPDPAELYVSLSAFRR